jgi:hypothetical protein
VILMDLVRKSEKLIVDNSPVILTIVGVSGTLTTAVLTGKASWKANNALAEEDDRRLIMNETVLQGTKEKALFVWKLYVPAVGAGVTTVSAIIFANRISTRRTAALAAAYGLSEKAFAEYKEKVLEKLGVKKEQAVHDEIAQDRVRKNPPGDVIFAGDGDVLCHDSLTGRYFKSSIEIIKKAQNDVNYEILHNMYASLSEFYDRIGLPTTPYSEEVGWNSDHMMEIMFSTVLTEANQPCISLEYTVSPIRGYARLQ